MSGAIAFSVSAASGGQSTIVADSVSASSTQSSVAFASIRYKPDGTIESITGPVDPAGDWVSPTSAASEWEIQATVASGNTPTGTIGSWVSLSSTRTWTLTQTSPGIKTCDLTFEFRRAAIGGAAEFTVTTNIIYAEVL